MNCGILSTLAGSLLAARMHSASPSALAGGAIDAITASVLGGVSFMGGGGSIPGMFLGVLLLSSFNNGLIGIGMNPYLQLVSQGGLLIIALSVDFYNTKAKERSLRKAGVKKET